MITDITDTTITTIDMNMISTMTGTDHLNGMISQNGRSGAMMLPSGTISPMKRKDMNQI